MSIIWICSMCDAFVSTLGVWAVDFQHILRYFIPTACFSFLDKTVLIFSSRFSKLCKVIRGCLCISVYKWVVRFRSALSVSFQHATFSISWLQLHARISHIHWKMKDRKRRFFTVKIYKFRTLCKQNWRIVLITVDINIWLTCTSHGGGVFDCPVEAFITVTHSGGLVMAGAMWRTLGALCVPRICLEVARPTSWRQNGAEKRTVTQR